MKVLKTFIAFLFLALGTSMSLNAQNREVSGQVLDAEQYPIIGAAVIYPGTGAVTDIDGTFTMTVPAGTVELEVSCMGYVTRKVTVPDAQSNITVILELDQMLIEETVVVGYGTQKKVNLTGAVSVIDDKALKDRSAHSVANMLQGSVAGLNITTSAGAPGSDPTINIRGVTSIHDSAPLVLIDGAEGNLNMINPNDVESISVIKDASAAAVYGARAAYGVILVTTKSGGEQTGGKKARIQYSGKFGWEEPTTSTDYETRGYWSVYTANLFWKAKNNSNYISYDDQDMMELLARVNDVTEHPDRPWTVEQEINGKKYWKYYGNYDWWHMLFRDQHPVQQHNVSISGGNKDVKYYVSGSYSRQSGILKQTPDINNRYNVRSKIDFKITDWMSFSNNTSFFSQDYNYIGVDNIQNAIAYGSSHALACFPMKNPDGSWLNETPWIGYKIANGRHIVMGEAKNINIERRSSFTNTAQLVIQPIKEFKITGNFTYKLRNNANTRRRTGLYYRKTPGAELSSYLSGAGEDRLTETNGRTNYLAANVFANYEQTFKGDHHLAATAGFNYESEYYKYTEAYGRNLLSTDLNDFALVGTDASGATLTGVDGSQYEYALMGVFARVNYDYKGRYLFEVSGRYDGSSRFLLGHQWGLFPSASAGWRISEEPWFAPAKSVVNNMKIRASYGSLGNQDVRTSGGGKLYYAALRKINSKQFAAFSFGEGSSLAQYTNVDAPPASDLTWETSQQYNVGLDMDLFNNRLNFTAEAYIRDTKNMLTEGVALPSVYGADSPRMNAADLRTSGYELAISWRDQFDLAGAPFRYNLGANVSDFKSVITKYDNPEKSFAKDMYEGMEIGEIWGFEVDGLFMTDAEAKAYAEAVDLSYINVLSKDGWCAGDLKFVDSNGNGAIDIGDNSVLNPGDRKVIGNKLPSLSYGLTGGFSWYGIDFSIFFQGTGNHQWYPDSHAMTFWGSYAYPYLTFMPRDFMDNVWAEDNKDAFYPRPMSYSTTQGPLKHANTRYIQNVRYLRLKNLTVGYTLPEKWIRKIGFENIRVYFTGENLAYWSPIKKITPYVDPEGAISRSEDDYNRCFYPWQKTFMFGIDITF